MRKAEIYFQEKHRIKSQERWPLTGLCTLLFEKVVKCEQILVLDVTLCYYWQLTQNPQALVNRDQEASDEHSKQIHW